MKTRAHRERGVALMIVIISIALLTVIGTEFAYNSRVDLQLAVNQRDDLRAHYMAKSGVAMARLILRFQQQLSQVQLPNLSSALSKFVPGAAPPAGGAPAGNLSLQIWRMARVDCQMLAALVPEAEDEKAPPPKKSLFDDDESDPETAIKMASRKFGGFEGCFNATISDESEKLNVEHLQAGALSGRPVVERMFDLFSGKRYEFVFDREDANRIRTTPKDVLINLKDWADEDDVSSSLVLAGTEEPMPRGGGDENGPYSRYTPRYRTKNARYDTLDELYMVHGVNDTFMAAFRDLLTVYTDRNQTLNVNSDDPRVLEIAIKMAMDRVRPEIRLNDPVFVDTIIKQIQAVKFLPIIGLSVQDFLNIVGNNIRVDSGASRMLSDKSTTFRIEAEGSAGSVKKKVTAVVRLDQAMGQLLYWREE